MSETADQETIEEFELQPIEVQVLSLERTYFEKVLSVNRLSYEGIPALQEKIRHFYDIHQLHTETELKGKILTPEYYQVMSNVRKDDEANRTMNGKWRGQLISASPLFTELDTTWGSLTDAYQNGLADLIWSENRPSSEDILKVLKEVKGYVVGFDDKFPPSPIEEEKNEDGQ
ncbi:nucleotidyl transferase AbiEii/AbiGii toxin family protein [Flavihumibacter profundi]|uniref:nucleotidyl transferase AbiEii/AbiGii toxin family protein n=1 Tax=Flavihumibacter profundi TaxID=2716883 RepID=UPI001CC670AC|nr:nucleotidyl transferase AbiEii/AbiGii toxin family protein [Flavihumibacter profundi]MBZ5857546.1 nucleotidyl transferase AbiEii/AbiGii toxin family protein [Flavihumibacter profundi]